MRQGLLFLELTSEEKEMILEQMSRVTASERRGWNQCLKYLFGFDGRALCVRPPRVMVQDDTPIEPLPEHAEPIPELVVRAILDFTGHGSKHFAQYKYRLLKNRPHRLRYWYEENMGQIVPYLGWKGDKIVMRCTDENYLELLRSFGEWLKLN